MAETKDTGSNPVLTTNNIIKHTMNAQQQELEKIREELQSLQTTTISLIEQTTNALANMAINQYNDRMEQQANSNISATALTPDALRVMISLILEKAETEAITQIEDSDHNIDPDDVVELEMGYNNQISINLDTDAIASSIVRNISIEDMPIDLDELMKEVQEVMQKQAQA